MANAIPPREPVKCAHPGCSVRFIPRAKTHIYCSQICKRRSHEYRFVLNPQRGR